MSSPSVLLAACAASHERLLAWLDGHPATDVARPSLLPGWSVGHVLTHLARNADGCRNMVEGAVRGEVWPMYPGGLQQRAEGIETGAARPFDVQVNDLSEATAALEVTWRSLNDQAWQGESVGPFGTIPVSTVPLRRLREVEIHWLDMGLGYTWADWPEAFVAADLSNRQSGFGSSVPDDVVALGDRAQLAWLFSRSVGEGVTPPPPWF